MVYHEKFQVETGHAHVTVLDVTQQVREIAARSGVKNGSILVYTNRYTYSRVLYRFRSFPMGRRIGELNSLCKT